MRRIARRQAVWAAAAALTLAVGLACTPALARPAAPAADHWRIVLQGKSAGSVVIAPARTSVWAFGVQTTGTPARTLAVARHWDGQRWSGPRPVSPVKNSYVTCAGSSSAADAWAFVQAGGGLGNPPSYAAVVRLRRGRWVTEKVFPRQAGTIMTGCNVLGPTDVWVFGGEVAGLGRTVGTWHLTRSGWRRFNTGNLVIFHASVVSGTDIWGAAADLSTTIPRPVLARWNGKHWSEDRAIDAALPRPTSSMFVAIQALHALSAHDVWVQAITYTQTRITGTVVVHWNGSAWHRVRRVSFGYHLPTAVTDGHGGWWAVPFPAAGSSGYLLHGARGHWTRFSMPPNVTHGDASYVHLSHVPRSAVMVGDGTLADGHGHFTPVLLAFGPPPR
jgi:hypothetical protein